MSDLNITIAGGTSKRLLVKGTLPRNNIVVTATGSAPVLQEKSITVNGEYTPESGYDGFSKVTVSIPDPVLQSKTVTENGTVRADLGYDGLRYVVVDVPKEVIEVYDGSFTKGVV